MWQRFSEKARKVVFYAQQEAGKVGQNAVGPEHLLLGVLRDDTFATSAVKNLGVDPRRVADMLAATIVPGDGHSVQDMMLTSQCKRVVDLACDEAFRMKNNHIGTEHLLMGVIRAGDSVCAPVLEEFGLSEETVRAEIGRLQPEGEHHEHAPSAVDPTDIHHARVCAYLADLFTHLHGVADAKPDDLAVTHLLYTLLVQSATDAGSPVIVVPNRHLTRDEVNFPNRGPAALSLAPHLHTPLLARVKKWAGLDTAEPHVISEKSRSLEYAGRQYMVAVSLVPSEFGQQIVFVSKVVRGGKNAKDSHSAE